MNAWLDDGDVRLYHGDAVEQLAAMPAESVQCIVTSPPFWALRDYGVDGQIGLEATPDEWCARLVAVFRECRRVLRDDGVMWLEVGDTYASSGERGTGGGAAASTLGKPSDGGPRRMTPNGVERTLASKRHEGAGYEAGVKPKDLVGAPWMLAFALRNDGWYLRSDTIWARPNPMPESVTDRPTKAHSYVFLLTKQARYFYDADAIREPQESLDTKGGYKGGVSKPEYEPIRAGGELTRERIKMHNREWNPAGRNARSVWSIATEPTPFAHFATFPQALVERCIKAGSREGDVILDPFMGSGTTALVARRLGRNAVGIELNADYLKIAASRLQQLSLLGGAS